MYNKNLRHLVRLTAFFSIFMSSIAQAGVMTTIKPIGLITEAIAHEVIETDILLPDGASPHSYALKPSDIQKLKQAELVISIGPDMEIFLNKILANLDKNKQIVLVEQTLIRPMIRQDHDHHEVDHAHESEVSHHHGHQDLHIWLSPEMAKNIAHIIYEKLVELKPQSKVKLENNLNAFLADVDNTTQSMTLLLSEVKDRGYFVFHDAYGYFEAQFQLNHLGHFTLNPAVSPGAKTLYDIKSKIKKKRAVCIFTESQFNPLVVEKIARSAQINMGNLDPLAMNVPVTSSGYTQFLTQLSQQFWHCLKPARATE